MISPLFCRLRKYERGSAPVRLFLLVVIILALAFGIINGGWILNGYITLNGAVREGVQIAASSEESSEVAGEIRAVVRDHAAHFRIADEDIEVYFASDIGALNEVIATGELELLISFSPLPDSVTLTASSTMRQ